MQPATAARSVARRRLRADRPTASIIDGSIEIAAYDVVELHEVFEHARELLRPIAATPGVRGIELVIRARDGSRGGSPATEIEARVRTNRHPISIRCVRPDAKAALELAAIVLRLRLTSSDKQSEAAQ